jgi:hypothetical protein
MSLKIPKRLSDSKLGKKKTEEIVVIFKIERTHLFLSFFIKKVTKIKSAEK